MSGKFEKTACCALLELGPTSASVLGAKLWPNNKRRGVASHGGGHYGAQMLLGRMRKLGLVTTLHGEGSSVWTLTASGRRLATESLDDDLWLQGFACALASLNRMHDHPSQIDDVLTGTGITIRKLKAAGVEDYDLDELKKCARKRSSK